MKRQMLELANKILHAILIQLISLVLSPKIQGYLTELTAMITDFLI